jgi:hypothetical protein
MQCPLCQTSLVSRTLLESQLPETRLPLNLHSRRICV